jgi:hypothetical protein
MIFGRKQEQRNDIWQNQHILFEGLDMHNYSYIMNNYAQREDVCGVDIVAEYVICGVAEGNR